MKYSAIELSESMITMVWVLTYIVKPPLGSVGSVVDSFNSLYGIADSEAF